MIVYSRNHPHGWDTFDAQSLAFVSPSRTQLPQLYDSMMQIYTSQPFGKYYSINTICVPCRKVEKYHITSPIKRVLLGKETIERVIEDIECYPIYIVKDGEKFYEPFTKMEFELQGYRDNNKCEPWITAPGVCKEIWYADVFYYYNGDGQPDDGNCRPVYKPKETLERLKNNALYRAAIPAYFEALRKKSKQWELEYRSHVEEQPQKQETFEEFLSNL